jgi:hypothetical protein
VKSSDLGAWVLKGNADHTDLIDRFARDRRVSRWCVRPSYRLGLMRDGQPVLFWGSGSKNRLVPYGIWGLGKLAGEPVRAGAEGGWSVPLELEIAERDAWLPRQVLRDDPRLAALEVLRQPQGANPSFVTVRQFAAIQELFPAHRPR